MNDFGKWLEEHGNGKKVSQEELMESMRKADEQEKALCVALFGLFTKKRAQTANMVKAVESMDILFAILKHAACEDLLKDLPDNKEVSEAGHGLISAIDGVLSALQQYNLANEKFNEAVRQDAVNKEDFKNSLDNIDE